MNLAWSAQDTAAGFVAAFLIVLAWSLCSRKARSMPDDFQIEAEAIAVFTVYFNCRREQGDPCPPWEKTTNDKRDRFRAIARRNLDADRRLRG